MGKIENPVDGIVEESLEADCLEDLEVEGVDVLKNCCLQLVGKLFVLGGLSHLEFLLEVGLELVDIDWIVE